MGYLFLAHDQIDIFKRNNRWNHLAQQNPAYGGFNQLRRRTGLHVHTHLDTGLKISFAGVIGHPYLFRRHKYLAGASHEGTFSGHVVKAQNHILRWYDNRLATGRRQDIVGRHHQHARLNLAFD